MNKVIEIGRLTRDPEVRYSKGENPIAVARFTLAVDRPHKQEGQPTADFFNVVAMGRHGEFAEKYLKKGVKIALLGRLQSGSYTNQEGTTVYYTEIVTENVEFAESKRMSEEDKDARDEASLAGYNTDGFMNIPDGLAEELPF